MWHPLDVEQEPDAPLYSSSDLKFRLGRSWNSPVGRASDLQASRYLRIANFRLQERTSRHYSGWMESKGSWWCSAISLGHTSTLEGQHEKHSVPLPTHRFAPVARWCTGCFPAFVMDEQPSAPMRSSPAPVIAHCSRSPETPSHKHHANGCIQNELAQPACARHGGFRRKSQTERV